MAENSRSDIVFHDVFISWTGADREAKNQIVEHLQKNGIFCLESDSECCGDFTQWSREAVQKCTVFLLLLTPNALKSQWIPVELAEQKKLPNANNRLLPVCVSNAFYQQQPWDIKNYASACFLEDTDYLDKILSGVKGLLNQNMYRTFRLADQPDYIKLIPLYKTRNFENKSDDFSKLYIPRTLTCLDDKQQVLESGVLLTEDNINQDVIFLHGGAGSGKTRYVDQLKAQLSDKVLPITLSCSRLAQQKDMDLVGAMYEAFRQKCGCRGFYTRAHFESLLTDKRLLLILDGMDEIPTAAQTNVFCSNLQKIINAGQRTLDVTLLLTSRNADDYKRLNFDGRNKRFYRLDPLTEENIRQLSEKLFFLFGAPEKDQGFYLQVADLDAEIKTNPLLLSQLAIVYTQQDELPQTAVEIYDAIFSICLEQDKYTQVLNNGDLQPILSKGKLSRTLKAFARLRYESLSRGENWEIEELFCRVLEPEYGEDAQDLAEDLVEYLQNRALLVADEFYHKMFLEYFTAVSFYDSAFGFDRKCKDLPVVQELFTHYSDPYWATVIQLFLVKVDAMVDAQATRQLYGHLSGWCQDDFTLLFNTCRELLRHKVPAQNVLTNVILQRSADGSYPAYGPLFWYIPEYNLYENVVTALLDHTDDPDFPKMLALTRDVCFIFGQKNTVTEILPQVDGVSLWKKANLTGIRGALCEIFCTGATDFAGGEDIYPRCFNVAEAKAFLQSDCGITGRMTTPFADELGLYAHDFVPVMGDYNIGFAALPYDIPYLEKKLNSHSSRKLRGLALSPTDAEQMAYMSFNSSHLDVCYIPENIIVTDDDWQEMLALRQFVFQEDKEIQYIRQGLRGMTEIGERMFLGLKGITQLVLPPEVTFIGERAFANCRNLRRVVFTNPMIDFGWDCFENSGVEEVEFADGMDFVSGFSQCRNLKTIFLPNSVTQLGSNAFEGCTALEEVSIPNGVKWISYRAFAGCKGLKKLFLPETLEDIANIAFAGCSGLTEINLPQSLISIGAGAFDSCTGLQEVEIPAGVTAIGHSTFRFCTGLTRVCLPEGIKTIGADAFRGCTGLQNINIPDSVTEIGNMAFFNCIGLADMKLPEHLELYRQSYFQKEEDEPEEAKPEETKISEDKILRIYLHTCPAHSQDTVLCLDAPVITLDLVAEAYQGVTELYIEEGFTQIAAHAFTMSDTLRRVHLPRSLKVLGECAFGMNGALEAVEMPEGLTRIEESAFMNCYNLREFTIPSTVTYIGEMAFNMVQGPDEVLLPVGLKEISDMCFFGSAVKKVQIPEGVTAIGQGVFLHCDNLQSLQIPQSVESIGNEAFHLCTGLTHVQMPNNLKQLGESVFAGCHQLQNITLPEGIPVVKWKCFDHCVSLTHIRVPASVQEIGEYAFQNCMGLTKVELPADLRVVDHTAFAGCTNITEVTIGKRFEDSLGDIFPDAKLEKVTFI